VGKPAATPIDRAKELVNERILALGLNDTHQSYEPMFTGLAVTHDEVTYLLQAAEAETERYLREGKAESARAAAAGMMYWLFLVGYFAGKAEVQEP
jgi:hypothetical protein